MHRDFHYYGTFMAARAAGIPQAASLDIAEYAEIVDETWNSGKNMHYQFVMDYNSAFLWQPKHWQEKHRVQRTVTESVSLKMMQKGGNRGEWFPLSWTGFHFLPNLDPPGLRSNSPAARYQQRYALPKGHTEEQQLICYPHSTLATAMLDDTRAAIKSCLDDPIQDHRTQQPCGVRGSLPGDL